MKKLSLLFTALLAASSVFAQDVIVTTDSQTIEAKVVEITDSQIRYHKFSNLDGPIFNISKSNVLRIAYENGETENFIGAGELKINKNSRYTIGGVRMSRAQVLRIAAPYDDVVRNIRAGVRLKKAAIVTGCVGGGITALGIVFTITSLSSNLLYGIDDYDDALVNTGLGIMGAGILIGLPSIGLGIGSVKCQNKAMRLYNEQLDMAEIPTREPATISLAFTQGGLGLQLNF
jgi:hypothetical protein